MKILLFIPTYKLDGGRLAMDNRCSESIENLDFADHDVTVWISADESANKKDNVFKQYQRCWKRARKEGFDAIMIIEHDMIVPPDAIKKLALVDTPVVYGIYLFRESGTLNAMRKTAHPSIDQSLDFFAHEREAAWKSVLCEVSGCGFGCTMIRREAFINIDVRQPAEGYFPDMPFADDCCKRGYKQIARFDVVCGHIRANGYAIYPDRDFAGFRPYNVRIEPRQSFVGQIYGESIKYKAGHIYEMPFDAAREYSACGLLTIVSTIEDRTNVS